MNNYFYKYLSLTILFFSISISSFIITPSQLSSRLSYRLSLSLIKNNMKLNDNDNYKNKTKIYKITFNNNDLYDNNEKTFIKEIIIYLFVYF